VKERKRERKAFFFLFPTLKTFFFCFRFAAFEAVFYYARRVRRTTTAKEGNGRCLFFSFFAFVHVFFPFRSVFQNFPDEFFFPFFLLCFIFQRFCLTINNKKRKDFNVAGGPLAVWCGRRRREKKREEARASVGGGEGVEVEVEEKKLSLFLSPLFSLFCTYEELRVPPFLLLEKDDAHRNTMGAYKVRPRASQSRGAREQAWRRRSPRGGGGGEDD